MLHRLLCLCLLTISFGACHSSKNTSVQNSKGLPLSSQWVLHYYMVAGTRQYPATKTAHITIAEDKATFTGHGGCNSMGGRIVLKEASLRFTDIYSTEMACDKLNDEQKFIQKLEEVQAYEIKGGELYLKKNGKTIMVLESFR